MAAVNLVINGEQVQAQEGMSILEAAREAGIFVPTLCYHHELEAYGACRLCVVELLQGERSRVVASCLYPVAEGLVVETESEKIRKYRRTILNLLLQRWDNIPQALLDRYGAGPRPRYRENMTFCILCGLCVRYCRDIKGANVLGFIGRGTIRQVVVFPNQARKYCSTCGRGEMECLEYCPTGVISSDYQGTGPADGQPLPHAYPICIRDETNILEILERVGHLDF